MRVIGVIPARYKSSRLGGKATGGYSGPAHGAARLRTGAAGQNLDDVLVATDDERIRRAVTEFRRQGRDDFTRHRSGTDRVAEAATALEADVVVNIQGDEPMLDPLMLEEVVAPFRDGHGRRDW